jgi:hypothetical protein
MKSKENFRLYKLMDRETGVFSPAGIYIMKQP